VKQPTLLILFVLLAMFCDARLQQTPVQSSKTPETQASRSETPASDVKIGEAANSFKNGDSTRALAILREGIALEPNNGLAHTLAGLCSLNLKDYPTAIKYLKRGLELGPDVLAAESGLMEAYSFAGMTKEGDTEREQLRRLQRESTLPVSFHFNIDFFEVGDLKVKVTEYFPELGHPDLAGGIPNNFRYWFRVSDQEGKQVQSIVLQSLDADQALWKKSHPKEAAAGQRKFSLDGYDNKGQRLYRFYDGEPSYTQLREDVKLFLQGKRP
jgi:Flp pilus assembly protein TadD